MALFQKKPVTSSSAPLYTLGLSKSLLIVGLGNIGKEYEDTRHNIGFNCIDEFATTQEFDPWVEKKDLKCFFTAKNIGNTRVILIKPTTLMNNSGDAVQATSHFYKIPPDQILVVHDELDIPFGQIRTRAGGSDAGNKGIKSIINHIGENFGRMRIGIKAPTKMKPTDFVLAKFNKEEQENLPALKKEVIAMLTEYVYGNHLVAETRSFTA
jgi:peptidyl-tRNA hydrolase, PTH1 family